MVVLPIAVFAVLALATEDRALIIVLNIVQVAVAVAVVVAFLPEMGRIIFTNDPMNRPSWLAYGIWVSWMAVVYRSFESLAWRIMGQPSWLINSDLTSAYLFMGTVGAISHIVKPGGLNERVPPREWIRIGVIIGLAVAMALLTIYGADIATAWTGPHDRGVTVVEEAAPTRTAP